MALNKYMHPRNPYKDRKPNFKLLSEKYPQFKEHSTTDNKGDVHIDFKKPECLKALSWALLKEDFDVDVLMPLDRLIPTIPLRINYILWMEDILAGSTSPVNAIDIGTGASCVYALIGAKKNSWNFLATETDATNFNYAKKNVEDNQLSDKITVKQVSEGTTLYDVLCDTDKTYDFCMCNPPFFGSNFEAWGMLTSRSTDRPEPSSINTASPVECIVPGGEVEFTKRMISDSLQLATRIRVYTTMLGKKSSLPVLKEELRRNGVTNVGQTEFCQGKTMRWGLGWSFDTTVQFPKAPTKAVKSQKAKPPLVLHVEKAWPVVQSMVYTIGNITDKILEYLNMLQIVVTDVQKKSKQTSFTITATKNTWSNQRRKRRQQNRFSNNEAEKQENVEMDSSNQQGQERSEPLAAEGQGQMDCGDDITKVKDTDDQVTSGEQADPPCCKMPKIEAEGNSQSIGDSEGSKSAETLSESMKNDNETPESKTNETFKTPERSSDTVLFSSRVCVKHTEDDDISIEMSWVEGTSRESMHQVLQYIKNKLST